MTDETAMILRAPTREREATELRAAADEIEAGDIDAGIERIGGVLGNVHELRAEARLFGGSS